MIPPEDPWKTGVPADVFMSVAKLGREVDELDLSPGLVPRLEGGLVQGLPQLEGHHGIVLGVKDEDKIHFGVVCRSLK